MSLLFDFFLNPDRLWKTDKSNCCVRRWRRRTEETVCMSVDGGESGVSVTMAVAVAVVTAVVAGEYDDDGDG